MTTRRGILCVYLILSIAAISVVSGCASLVEVDRSRLDHPAMDLSQRRTPAKSNELSSLGSIDGSSGGGGCLTCVK